MPPIKPVVGPDPRVITDPIRPHDDKPSWMHENLPKWGGRIAGGYLGAKVLGGPLSKLGFGCVGVIGATVIGAWVGGTAAQKAADTVDRASDSGSTSQLHGALVGAAVGALTLGGVAAIAHGLGMAGAGGAALMGRSPMNIALQLGETALKGAIKPAITGLVLGGAVGAIAPEKSDEMWGAVRDSAIGWRSLGIGVVAGAAIGGGLNLLALKNGSATANPVKGAIVGALAVGALVGGTGAMIRVGSSAVGGSIAAATN